MQIHSTVTTINDNSPNAAPDSYPQLILFPRPRQLWFGRDGIGWNRIESPYILLALLNWKPCSVLLFTAEIDLRRHPHREQIIPQFRIHRTRPPRFSLSSNGRHCREDGFGCLAIICLCALQMQSFVFKHFPVTLTRSQEIYVRKRPSTSSSFYSTIYLW